ncbi:MAG: DUF58 domain-containing protein [Candidatus Eutrophobiaceae bacterium]
MLPRSSPVRIDSARLFSLKEVGQGINLRSSRAFSGRFGAHLSPFKGRGMEYEQSRLYTPGDDVRNLDWRVTARTGRAYTKLFREERERPVQVCVDYRRAMFFATRGCYKAVMASECAVILAWGAISGGDRLGGMIFDDVGCTEWKPMRGHKAVLRLVDRLCSHPAWEGEQREQGQPATNGFDAVERALFRLARITRPGSLLFLLGDFRSFGPRALNLIAELGRHSEIVLALIYDPLERNLPARGSYYLRDGHHEKVINTWDAKLRSSHNQRFERRMEDLQRMAANPSIHFLVCSTQDEPAAVMLSSLAGR